MSHIQRAAHPQFDPSVPDTRNKSKYIRLNGQVVKRGDFSEIATPVPLSLGEQIGRAQGVSAQRVTDNDIVMTDFSLEGMKKRQDVKDKYDYVYSRMDALNETNNRALFAVATMMVNNNGMSFGEARKTVKSMFEDNELGLVIEIGEDMIIKFRNFSLVGTDVVKIDPTTNGNVLLSDDDIEMVNTLYLVYSRQQTAVDVVGKTETEYQDEFQQTAEERRSGFNVFDRPEDISRKRRQAEEDERKKEEALRKERERNEREKKENEERIKKEKEDEKKKLEKEADEKRISEHRPMEKTEEELIEEKVVEIEQQQEQEKQLKFIDEQARKKLQRENEESERKYEKNVELIENVYTSNVPSHAPSVFEFTGKGGKELQEEEARKQRDEAAPVVDEDHMNAVEAGEVVNSGGVTGNAPASGQQHSTDVNADPVAVDPVVDFMNDEEEGQKVQVATPNTAATSTPSPAVAEAVANNKKQVDAQNVAVVTRNVIQNAAAEDADLRKGEKVEKSGNETAVGTGSRVEGRLSQRNLQNVDPKFEAKQGRKEAAEKGQKEKRKETVKEKRREKKREDMQGTDDIDDEKIGKKKPGKPDDEPKTGVQEYLQKKKDKRSVRTSSSAIGSRAAGEFKDIRTRERLKSVVKKRTENNKKSKAPNLPGPMGKLGSGSGPSVENMGRLKNYFFKLEEIYLDSFDKPLLESVFGEKGDNTNLKETPFGKLVCAGLKRERKNLDNARTSLKEIIPLNKAAFFKYLEGEIEDDDSVDVNYISRLIQDAGRFVSIVPYIIKNSSIYSRGDGVKERVSTMFDIFRFILPQVNQLHTEPVEDLAEYVVDRLETEFGGKGSYSVVDVSYSANDGLVITAAPKSGENGANKKQFHVMHNNLLVTDHDTGYLTGYPEVSLEKYTMCN